MLALTAVTIAAWSLVDPSRAFTAALAVLVVSCPCAFALAVPSAITRALAVLARRGVLVVRPDAIETLAGATHVVFDKTGTLTEPVLAVAGIETGRGLTREAALEMAATLARESRHPAARAIAVAASDRGMSAAANVRSETGRGIEGTLGGRRLRLGRAEFALEGEARVAAARRCRGARRRRGRARPFRLDERLRPAPAPRSIPCGCRV